MKLAKRAISLIMLCPIIALGACNGDETPPETTDTAGTNGATPADTAPPTVTPADITRAPQGFEADTIPLRAPDGSPARYGIESGRIVLRYVGGMEGQRVMMFDRYGMRERTEENAKPKEGQKGPRQNFIRVNLPEYFGMVDLQAKQGWRMPNSLDDMYLKSDSSKRFSFGEVINMTAQGTRKGVDTIYGFVTNVREVTLPGLTHTIWTWRGIPIREHFVAPVEGMEFYLEPVEVSMNITIADSLFQLPKNYPIKDRSEPRPGEVMDPPAKPTPMPMPPPGQTMPGRPPGL